MGISPFARPFAQRESSLSKPSSLECQHPFLPRVSLQFTSNHMLTDHALADLATLDRQLTGNSLAAPDIQTMGERLLRLVDVLLRPSAPADPSRGSRSQ